MTLTRQQTTVSNICKIGAVTLSLGLLACAGIQRPDADICGINFAADRFPHLHCYNIKKDFSNDGVLLAGAKPHDKNIYGPQMLNAGKYISKEDWPKVQVWLQDMRDYAKEHCE